MRDHQGREFPAVVGLRPRHLEILSDLAETKEVTVPRRRDSRRRTDRTTTVSRDLPVVAGPASPAVPHETIHLPAPTAESTRLPDHVRDLLERFPVSGPEFFQHALRLDRMAALHRDVPVADLTRHHLAYTDALISTAVAMYNAVPDHAFDGPDLTRFRALLELVADQDGAVPDARTLVRQLADAMDVDRFLIRDVEGLSRFAEWYRATGGQRFPGERGVKALTRAAGELFGDVEGTRAVVEVAHLFASVAELSPSMAYGEVGRHFGVVVDAVREALAAREPGTKLSGYDLAQLVESAVTNARTAAPVARDTPGPGATAYAPENPVDPLTGSPVRGPRGRAGFAGLPTGAVAFHHDPDRPDPAGWRAPRPAREVEVRPIGDWFVADGRRAALDDLTVAEARAAFDAEVEPADLGSRSMTWSWVDDTTLLIGDRHITFEVGPVDGAALSHVQLGEGTAQAPDRVRLAARIAPDQAAPTVLAVVSDVFQQLTAPRTTMAALTGHPDGRDTSHNARQNVFRLLSRQYRTASTPEARAELRARLDAVLATFTEGVPEGAGRERLDRLRTLAEPPPAPTPAHTSHAGTRPSGAGTAQHRPQPRHAPTPAAAARRTHPGRPARRQRLLPGPAPGGQSVTVGATAPVRGRGGRGTAPVGAEQVPAGGALAARGGRGRHDARRHGVHPDPPVRGRPRHERGRAAP
ncbi:hypothetical protein ACFQES_18530 [Nonomuraea salmonea]|uniref:hypothetical protein n=1 Tax=Nonomuraea salmonea TaxID=46181 RepID=UPI003620E227